ncbi:MAG: hypothetical protein AAFR59_19950, partial [Bacteroidota bacterium]
MLIAESGATKTEWRLIKNQKVELAFRTPGFNPNVMAPEMIQAELAEIRKKHLWQIEFDELVFYGAGLKDSSMRALMGDILQQIFKEEYVSVFHDLQASIHSTGFEEGIVCILGTGSNSCHYKHGKILSQRGGHGYLLGDEGSGADLGHALIKGLLEGDLPQAVKSFIEFQEGGSVSDIRLAIYRDPKPNVRMARFAKYLDEVIHHPEVQELVTSRFLAFLDSTVCRYPSFDELPITFVGSISFYFQEWLLKACNMRGLHQIHIMHDPIDQLVQYHIKEKESRSTR